MYYWNVCFDTLQRERFSVDSEGIERLIQFSTICGSRHLICQIARIVSGQRPVLNMTLRKMIPTVTPLRKRCPRSLQRNLNMLWSLKAIVKKRNEL